MQVRSEKNAKSGRRACRAEGTASIASSSRLAAGQLMHRTSSGRRQPSTTRVMKSASAAWASGRTSAVAKPSPKRPQASSDPRWPDAQTRNVQTANCSAKRLDPSLGDTTIGRQELCASHLCAPSSRCRTFRSRPGIRDHVAQYANAPHSQIAPAARHTLRYCARTASSSMRSAIVPWKRMRPFSMM